MDVAPAGGLRLFRNRPGEDFAQGPVAGMDECLPTIAACSWQGRSLPDHGEVWSEAWQVDCEAWESGIMKTSIKLKLSPLEFERTLELSGHEVRLGYRLTNVNTCEESFLWAIHPLLKLCPGDRLEAPASTTGQLIGTAWAGAVESAIPENHYVKVFAGPISEGWVAINNQHTSDRLELEWDPAENGTLGLWLTRDGWHGHQHFAPEPTNADVDALNLAAQRNCCGVVPPSASVSWDVCLRID